MEQLTNLDRMVERGVFKKTEDCPSQDEMIKGILENKDFPEKSKKHFQSGKNCTCSENILTYQSTVIESEQIYARYE